ncbi:MAG: cation diffusion facilitator family transporter [bacterium]
MSGSSHYHVHESKTLWVALLSAAATVVEVAVGYYTHSIALIADGWHMATDVLAVGLSWFAYRMIRTYSNSEKLSFHKEKVLALSGFLSAMLLLIIGSVVAYESIERFVNPSQINFSEALPVAFVGLVVNAVSAILLRHKPEDSDHNIRAAYSHLIADALTSVAAIVALTLVKVYGILWLDTFCGIIGAGVIASWSVSLLRSSGKTLIDFQKK